MGYLKKKSKSTLSITRFSACNAGIYERYKSRCFCPFVARSFFHATNWLRLLTKMCINRALWNRNSDISTRANILPLIWKYEHFYFDILFILTVNPQTNRCQWLEITPNILNPNNRLKKILDFSWNPMITLNFDLKWTEHGTSSILYFDYIERENSPFPS